MKLKSTILALAFGLALLTPQNAPAAYSLTLTDTVGDPNSIATTAGSQFSLTLTLFSTGDSSISVDYFLQVLGGGSGFFRLTGRDLSGSSFSQPVTANNIALQSSRALLDPQNDDNLGASLLDPNSPNGAGSFLVANLTLLALPGIAPGIYTLGTFGASVGDGDFNDNPVPDASYRVRILGPAAVPEAASSALLLLIALGALAVFQQAKTAKPFRSHR